MTSENGRVGVISDTHGLLRAEALKALEGSDIILHGGDVGKEEILDQLGEIAPVVAVRGNVDYAPGCRELPLTEVIEFAGKTLYMIHILDDLELNPAAADIDVVITGHTHQPRIQQENSVLYLNPGSAGPRRFRLPVSVAIIEVVKGDLDARILELRV